MGKIMKNQKGMTLLELILAMTMLGVVALGMSGFSANLGRWLLMQKQDVGMQQDYDHAFNRVALMVQQFISNHPTYDLRLSFNVAARRSRVEFLVGAPVVTDSLILDAVQTAVGATNTLETTLTEASVAQPTVVMLSTATMRASAFVPAASTVTLANRTTCLSNPTALCFNASCGNVTNIDFNSNPCILNSTFPFFQIQNSAFGAILYLSLQAARNNGVGGVSLNGLAQKMGTPMTKAIPLNRQVTRRVP